MPELIPVLKKDEINNRLVKVAEEISADFPDQQPVVIGVLKGAFVFMSDLVRHLRIPVQIDFVQVASYGGSDVSSETIRLCKGMDVDVRNRHVILVEDIVDTGLTLGFLLDHINSYHPASLKVCTFIDKPERRKTAVSIDYKCHTVEQGFLVGYGLDYAENYRQLPEVFHLKF